MSACLEQATSWPGRRPIRATVGLALEDFVRRMQARQILSLRGSGAWHGVCRPCVTSVAPSPRAQGGKTRRMTLLTPRFGFRFFVSTILWTLSQLSLSRKSWCVCGDSGRFLQGFRDEQAFRVARDSLWPSPAWNRRWTRTCFSRGCRPYRAVAPRFTDRSGVDVDAAARIRNDLVVNHQTATTPPWREFRCCAQRLAGARI